MSVITGSTKSKFFDAKYVDYLEFYYSPDKIKDSNTNLKPNSFETTKIEVIPEKTETTSKVGARANHSAMDGSLEIAKILYGVEKSYDKGKFLLDESKNNSKFAYTYKTKDGKKIY